jgi:hypothetical protein
MNQKQLNKLIDKTKNQIFLLYCPCRLPISFAPHLWFVISEKGKLSRYETLGKKNKTGHIHINDSPPYKGRYILYPIEIIKWKSKLLKELKLNQKEINEIIKIIKTSPEKYPLNSKYKILGPNSNTYIQWILNQIPKNKTKLPKNAIGKNFKF